MNHCPECEDTELTLSTIGWVYDKEIKADKVTTTKVVTAVLACPECDWEQHGLIHPKTQTFVLAD